MTAYIILNETNAAGAFIRETLVNIEAIVRVVPEGPSHCALLLRSFTSGLQETALACAQMDSSRLYVEGALRELHTRLNVAGA